MSAPLIKPANIWVRRGVLIAIVFGTILAWQFSWGQTLLYPFTLFSTYIHEMGHGISALILGNSFQFFELNSDGSGVAHWVGSAGALSRALIAAGGLVGPSLIGALLLVASSKPWARFALIAFGVLILISLLIWGRTWMAWFLLVPVSSLFVLVGFKLPRSAGITLEFIALQLCLSVYSDLDYMFSSGAQVLGTQQVSDTQAMANALWLPYWFWGALTALFSLAVILWGMRKVLRADAQAFDSKKKPPGLNAE